MLVVGNITWGHVVKVEVPSNGLCKENIFRVKGTVRDLLLYYFPWFLGKNRIDYTSWQRCLGLESFVSRHLSVRLLIKYT
jgi:hypothetical protein